MLPLQYNVILNGTKCNEESQQIESTSHDISHHRSRRQACHSERSVCEVKNLYPKTKRGIPHIRSEWHWKGKGGKNKTGANYTPVFRGVFTYISEGVCHSEGLSRKIFSLLSGIPRRACALARNDTVVIPRCETPKNLLRNIILSPQWKNRNRCQIFGCQFIGLQQGNIFLTGFHALDLMSVRSEKMRVHFQSILSWDSDICKKGYSANG